MATYPRAGDGITVALEGSAPDSAEAAKIGLFSILNQDFDKVKTLKDLAMRTVRLEQFPAVKAWRDKLFSPEGIPEICDELPRLLTEFLRNPENRSLPAYSRRALALKYVFANKTALVGGDDLLPGRTTTSFVGPVVYVDTIGYCIWPELKTLTSRAQNPFKIRPEVAERLSRDIFPFWLEQKTVSEVARYSDYDSADYENRDRTGGRYPPSIDPPLRKKAGQTPKAQELMERVAFFLSDKATCVSHTVPDFERVLRYGFDGLIARAQQDIAATPLKTPQQIEFLQGVVAVFEGAKIYAEHLAEAAERAGNGRLAEICRKVPARPVETLHEALAAIWICYHLLLQENSNVGFSIGRLDQLLNPYYLADWQQLDGDDAKEAYSRRAVELICHFFLRCCDHVPLSTSGSETLFAGSGSNQALTVGGTHYRQGQAVDAVNDMTYIVLKATEILAIRDPSVHARYHRELHHRDADGRPLPPEVMDPYLRRICQVNVLTRAQPVLHADEAVIPAIAGYYVAQEGVSLEQALADAYDYTSIGCIEENAAHKHYGNTGSTLMVLPAVLELAIFGGKHRSDGVDPDAPNLFHAKPEYTTKPLQQQRSMEEFVDAFRFQLNEMAKHVVQCNNYLGRFYEQERPSPLLSGLFTGPINTPDSDDAVFRDVAAGGAKYNSAGIAVIGLADVVDSFCVLDRLVFGGKISAGELLAAMQADFEAKNLQQGTFGNGFWPRLWDRAAVWLGSSPAGAALPKLSKARLQEIRVAIRLAPKYGIGVESHNETALKYEKLVTEMLQEVFGQYRTHRGGRYLPGYCSMTNHAGFGMLAKALPNGRRSGKPFACGMTPWAVRGTDPVNGDFAEDSELFSRYMKTFADQNGGLVPMCPSSIAELTAADRAATAAHQAGAGEEEQKALAPFKDLMVRVAGYSAYFVTLSPQMRQEIIQRADFALETGAKRRLIGENPCMPD